MRFSIWQDVETGEVLAGRVYDPNGIVVAEFVANHVQNFTKAGRTDVEDVASVCKLMERLGLRPATFGTLPFAEG